MSEKEQSETSSEPVTGADAPQAFAYDDAFRTLESECDELLIPLVNFLFGEFYDETAVVTHLQNELFYMDDDKKSNKRITDSRFRIEQGGRSKVYHMECESKPYDGTILVRIFEYAAIVSKEDAETDLEHLTVNLPASGLLLLRGSPKAPSQAEIRIVTPGGEVTYQVPILKVSDVDLEKLYKEKLYFLLPFFIFRYESELGGIAADEERLEKLVELYQGIRDHLEGMLKRNEMTSFTFGVVMDTTKIVLRKLSEKHQNIVQKVGGVMGGQVLKLEILRYRDELVESQKKLAQAEERERLNGEKLAQAEERERLNGEKLAQAEERERLKGEALAKAEERERRKDEMLEKIQKELDKLRAENLQLKLAGGLA